MTLGTSMDHTAGFVRFPPKWQHILIPERPRRATALGMTLYTASRPKPLAALWALWVAARVGGARLVPGPRESWAPPFDEQILAELWEQWCTLAGPPEGIAIYTRLQTARPGLVLMLCCGRRRVIVRVRDDPASMVLEQRISEAAERTPPSTFAVPRVVGTGASSGWHWVAYEAMSRRPHSPARRLAPGTTAEIGALVEAALPRPEGTPEHWRGAHGDLSPWNLRRTGRRVWLIDWEDAEWAPPGSDAVYFAAVCSALRREPTGPVEVTDEHVEARAFWAERVARRVAMDTEVQLQRRLSVLLGVEHRV